ncbi:uncharacterized protein LOC132721007 [Ruditapes philippinarum]|uniref:uncharacterized protein LOC132721007 n=1 Tax=Ruditapes philippinarum TaxID=129788 RepID=UPI00295AED46|nr:uncharacterized protein LOC132721007 [Ruditapes philippinarum]
MNDPLAIWALNRRKTIKELRKLGEEMKNHAKNAKIASAVGGGTSVAAGIGAAICYFIAPITLGASVVPGIALTGIAIAGGVTSIGSSVTNYFIEKGYLRSVQEALDKDRESFEALNRAVQIANEETARERLERAFKIGKSIPGGLNVVASVVRKLTVSEKAAASLLKLGRTARFASHTVAFIALPLDVIFFVKDLIDLKRGNISQVADSVMELAEKLQKELEEILANS